MAETSGFLAPTENVVQDEFDPALEAAFAFEETCKELDLEGEIVQRLRHPERELTVHLPLAVHGGQALAFSGMRVQHNTTRGPAMGPVSLGPSLHLAQLKARAMSGTWQCALLDLPFGGAAGGVVCDPARLSESELRHLVKAYVRALHGVIGPFRDVLTPEAGLNARIMAWMADGYAQACRHTEPGAVTGKPSALAGLSDDLAQHYLFFLLREILEQRQQPILGQRIVIDGVTTGSLVAVDLLSQAGARILAISDVSGALFNDQGLSIDDVTSYAAQNGMLFGYPSAESISSADLLQTPCDILILAGSERSIALPNAAPIQAHVVVEAAPCVLTVAAAKELALRGVNIIPELLAGAGTMLASFFEWSKNVRNTHWSSAELDRQLQGRAQTAYREVLETAARHSTTARHAAHLLAIGRVAEALRLRR